MFHFHLSSRYDLSTKINLFECQGDQFSNQEKENPVIMYNVQMYQQKTTFLKNIIYRCILFKQELNMNKVTLINVYRPNHDDPAFFNDPVLKPMS